MQYIVNGRSANVFLKGTYTDISVHDIVTYVGMA